MPASTEPRSGLSYGWSLGENNWNTGMDNNLLSVGRFAYHLSVKSKSIADPPASPTAGDSYIVAASGTGAWAGKDAQVTVWSGTAWVFGVPRTGWGAYVEDESVHANYVSGAWGSEAAAYTDEQVRDVMGVALVAGTNVTITVDDASDTITIAAPSGASYSDEQVRDVMGVALVAGTNVTITVDDAADTITIDAAGSSYTDEQARDAIGTALVAGTGVTVTVDDAADTITVASKFTKASVYLNTATNTASSAWKVVPIDTVSYDPDSIFDTVNKRFIPESAGYYMVNARSRTDASGQILVSIYKNGALDIVVGVDASTSTYASGGSVLIYCNGTTDYLEMGVYANSARAMTLGVYDTYMQVLGPF